VIKEGTMVVAYIRPNYTTKIIHATRNASELYQKGKENHTSRTFKICSFHYYWGNQFKQDKTAGTYGMYGEEKYRIVVEKS
jgi:hypothetical protein